MSHDSINHTMIPTIVTCANFGYRLLSENLLRNFNDVIKHHKLVFYCLDDEIYEALKHYTSERIIFIPFSASAAPTVYASYDTDAFFDITRAKVHVILDALAKYEFVHFVDGDIVFTEEITEEYYAAYADYDIVFQSDDPKNVLSIWACSGNFVARNNERTRRHFERVESYMCSHPVNDQQAQYELFVEDGIKSIDQYTVAKLHEFPHVEFTCGYIFINRLCDPSTIKVFHANYVIGLDAKINLLKAFGKWYMS
jgi:hypothetical protein